jgi:hypothetical protein
LEPNDNATHTLEDMTMDSAVKGVELLDTGAEGRELNAAWPE